MQFVAKLTSLDIMDILTINYMIDNLTEKKIDFYNTRQYPTAIDTRYCSSITLVSTFYTDLSSKSELRRTLIYADWSSEQN